MSFPGPPRQPGNKKPVERLVDRILAAKQRDAEADTSALERQIDEWVYALHGLTTEEIKLVENSNRKKFTIEV
ncbi:MAG: hypothetical protein HY043_24465 [Verrucomicrobia bacterium]|nr:hypothetical protein [Verrucomicrobiota bacterium]